MSLGMACGAISTAVWHDDVRMMTPAALSVLFVVGTVAPPEWSPFQTVASPYWGRAQAELWWSIAVGTAGTAGMSALRGPLRVPWSIRRGE